MEEGRREATSQTTHASPVKGGWVEKISECVCAKRRCLHEREEGEDVKLRKSHVMATKAL